MGENANKLIFADGSAIQFAAGSSIHDFIGVYSSFAEVDDVRTRMTERNLKGATFNGETIDNIIPDHIKIIDAKYSENIEVHFICQERSTIEILQDQITELQKALAEITG